METSLEELRDLGLFPSDEALIAARETKKSHDLAAAEQRVRALEAQLDEARVSYQALLPNVSEEHQG